MFEVTRMSGRQAAMAALLAGVAALVPEIAAAGECPAGKEATDAREPGPMQPKAVTDTVLAEIDLGKEALKLDDRRFRLRRLVIQPGGVVPWHSHADRPAIIYIVQGSVTEYASTCSVPIVHKAGEVAMESIGLSHWWKNTGKKPAVLLSADLLHVEEKADMM